MVKPAGVVEEGLSLGPDPAPQRPTWLVGIVGFLVGLGLGVLVVNPIDQTPPGSEDVARARDNLASPSETSPEDDIAPGTSGAIPGFPDAIVAVLRTTGSALEHFLWPVKGEPVQRPMTGGQGVLIDPGGRFIALSEGIPGQEGNLLSMGRFNSIWPVAPGVTSYAWHDSLDGWLSYTSASNGVTELFTVKIGFEPNPVTELDAGASVVGWGEWGWAIQQGPGIVLLNEQGLFKDSEPGVGLATHSSGWVLAQDDVGIKLVSAGGGVRRVPDSHDETLERGAFSPDGDLVALSGRGNFEVLDLGTMQRQPLIRILGDMTPVWSSDSRFVLLSGSSGVFVIDRTGEVQYRMLNNEPVAALGVVPLQSS